MVAIIAVFTIVAAIAEVAIAVKTVMAVLVSVVAASMIHDDNNKETMMVIAMQIMASRVAKWNWKKVAKFSMRSCQKLPNQFFLLMTS